MSANSSPNGLAVRDRRAAPAGETVDPAWRLRRPAPLAAEPWATDAPALGA